MENDPTPINARPKRRRPEAVEDLALALREHLLWPLEDRLLATLDRHGWNGQSAPVFIQCFDVLPLKTIMTLVQAPRIQLVSPEGGPTDVTLRYKDMVRPDGLKAIAAYAQGVGTEWSMVLPTAFAMSA